MIDIEKARISFKRFLDKYKGQEELGFDLKVVHTYQVVTNAKTIATNLHLSEEDIKLAEVIGLLHDIGRFEEITFLKEFDSVKFDHAAYGVKMLFEDGMIRDFLDDSQCDEIIKVAIDNHSRLAIEEGLDERSLLHAKIIRDADKLDNFRVKKEDKIEAIFPGKAKSAQDMEISTLSDKVYETVQMRKCVDIRDRQTVLDYWVCVLAFMFDLNFKESYALVKENDYVNILVDRFKYKDIETQKKMEEVRNILNTFVEEKLNS